MRSIIPRRLTPEIAPYEPSTWDPFELMRNMLRWDPFREIEPTVALPALWTPAFEVKETREAFVFKADVPGLKEEHLNISITGNRLTVAGKREEEKREETDRLFTYERNYGSFTRTFTLPEGVDTEHVAAELRDGVLTLNLPKLPEVQPKKIELKVGKTVKA